MLDKTILNELLDAMRKVEGKYDGGWEIKIVKSTEYGSTRYLLNYFQPDMVDGHSVRIDVDRSELWCSPDYSSTDESKEQIVPWSIMKPALNKAREIQKRYGKPVNSLPDASRQTYFISKD